MSIRSAFLLSLSGHLILLGMPGLSLNIAQTESPQEIVVTVEIERPPLLPKIDVLGEEKKLKEIVEEPVPVEPEPEVEVLPEETVAEQPPEEPVEQVVEVVDSDREAMLRYQDMVKQRIEEARRYPLSARRQGIEGTVYLGFVVLSDGSARDIKIIRSSGSGLLDRESVATIQKAGPFPPVPGEISSSTVRMELSIVFTLE